MQRAVKRAREIAETDIALAVREQSRKVVNVSRFATGYRRSDRRSLRVMSHRAGSLFPHPEFFKRRLRSVSCPLRVISCCFVVTLFRVRKTGTTK